MKEKYIKPDSDIQKFATVDVITTSGGGDEPIVTPPDWNDLRVKESRFYVLTPFDCLAIDDPPGSTGGIFSEEIKTNDR